MSAKLILGDRLLIKRNLKVDMISIEVPERVAEVMRGREPTFEGTIVMLGNGAKLAKEYPELQPGMRLIIQKCGSQKMGDGTEIISVLDVLAILQYNDLCEQCGGQGWYMDGPQDNPQQRQCEACHATGIVLPA